ARQGAVLGARVYFRRHAGKWSAKQDPVDAIVAALGRALVERAVVFVEAVECDDALVDAPGLGPGVAIAGLAAQVLVRAASRRAVEIADDDDRSAGGDSLELGVKHFRGRKRRQHVRVEMRAREEQLAPDGPGG